MSFSCAVCYKSFASNWNLKRHLSSKLLICGATIRTSSTSVIHPIPTISPVDDAPTHTATNVDALPPNQIAQVDDASENKTIVSEELYKCINCGKGYKYRQGLFKHRTRCLRPKETPVITGHPHTTIIQNTYIGSVYNIQKVNSDNASTLTSSNTTTTTTTTTNNTTAIDNSTNSSTVTNTANFNIRNNILYDGDKPIFIIRNPIEHECVDIIPKEVFISLLALRKYKECPNLTDYIMQNIISKIYEDTSNKSFYKPNLNKTIVLTSTKDFKRTSIAEKELIEKIKFNVEKILCKLYFKHLDSMDIDTQIQCYKNIIHISREIERSSKRFNHYISNIIANNSMFDRESIINYFNLIDANNLNDIITKYFNESCKFQNMSRALPIKNSIGEFITETLETTKTITDVMKTAQTQYSHENLPIQLKELEDEKIKNDGYSAFMKRTGTLFSIPKFTGSNDDDDDASDY